MSELIDELIEDKKENVQRLKEEFTLILDKPHNRHLSHIIYPFRKYEDALWNYIELLKRKLKDGENIVKQKPKRE